VVMFSADLSQCTLWNVSHRIHTHHENRFFSTSNRQVPSFFYATVA
jgi:hypothetical protein